MATTTRPSLAFEIDDAASLVVLKHGRASPGEEDWESYLSALRQLAGRLGRMRILVFTDGGRPLLEQQKKLSELCAGRSVRTAIVSSSVAVRFVIAMFALVNPGIQGFDSTHRTSAFDYLELTPYEREVADQAQRRLSLALELESPQAA